MLVRGTKDLEPAMAEVLKNSIAVVGIDIGKNSFHVVGLDKSGAIVLRQKWSRNQVEARFANMPPGLIGRAMVSFRVSITDSPAWLAGYGSSDRRSACGFGLGLPHWHYAASFGIGLSTNRKNRVLRVPDLNLPRYRKPHAGANVQILRHQIP